MHKKVITIKATNNVIMQKNCLSSWTTYEEMYSFLFAQSLLIVIEDIQDWITKAD